MNSPRYDTNNYWTLRHKIHDLVDNRTISVSTPVTENNGTKPLASHAAVSSGLTVNMISIEEFTTDRHSS